MITKVTYKLIERRWRGDGCDLVNNRRANAEVRHHDNREEILGQSLLEEFLQQLAACL